jgi:hypothetical protein
MASLERHMPSEIWYKPIAEVGAVARARPERIGAARRKPVEPVRDQFCAPGGVVLSGNGQTPFSNFITRKPLS